MSQHCVSAMITHSRIFTILIFLLGTIVFDSCRVKRCPMDSCHIRMRHRHPSMMSGGKGESAPPVYDASAGSEANLGPIYRGIPWWQRYRETKVQQGAKNYKIVRTRDPKIGQGYKPGYKYKHKDNKPWSERMKKYKKKKIEDQEKEDKKALKKGNEPENQENTEEGATEDLNTSEEKKPEQIQPSGESVEAATPEEAAPKESKKERKARLKKEKQAKKKKDKNADTEEKENTEEKEEEGF